MGEPMLGQVMAFGGSYHPVDWALCNGQLLTLTNYAALYSVMGTAYGGDGRTTFGVPDLCGRSPVGMGAGAGRTTRYPGEFGGYEYVTLATTQLPSHTHASAAEITGDVVATVNCYTGTTNIQSSPSNAVMASQGLSVPDNSRVYSRSDPNATMASSSVTTQNDLDVAVSIGETGSGQAHVNMHPWICLNYIIALEGYYPTRP